MKYIKSDFGRECLYLRYPPTNATETYNKLVCLLQRDINNGLDVWDMNYSKRRTRLIKTYWAFRKMEKRVNKE